QQPDRVAGPDPERVQAGGQSPDPRGVLAERDRHAVDDRPERYLIEPLGGGQLEGLAHRRGVERARTRSVLRPDRDRALHLAARSTTIRRLAPGFRYRPSSVTVRPATKPSPATTSSSTSRGTGASVVITSAASRSCPPSPSSG